MKKILTVLLVLVAAGTLFTACGKKTANKIVVATDATWPPMEMVDTNKEIVGFDIDIFKAAAEKAGFMVEFKNTSWDGIFAGLDNGDFDAIISSVTITTDRQAKYDFSLPYINAGQVIVVRTETANVTTLNDLSGKTAGAQISTTGALEIGKVKSVKLRTYDELGLAIKDLINKRIDAVVCDTPIAANYALQSDEFKGKLKIVGEPFTQEVYGIVVKKGNTKTLDLINKGLKAVLDAGLNKDLEKKWLR